MDRIRKGTWVQIHKILLNPEERSPNLPLETKKVPFEMRVKGFLLREAEIGDKVTIQTAIGREIEGVLVEANPRYVHNFGVPILELLQIGEELKDMLRRGKI